MNIGIYIYDKAEVLDFSGPFEVFSTANRLTNDHDINTFLISEKGEMVKARGGFNVMPHYSVSNHPTIDILMIVGGVHAEEMNKKTVLSWIKESSNEAQIVASVCTGAFLLAQSKVLTKQTITTHWEDIPSLKEQFPRLNVITNQRWVDEGRIVTSGGISSGIHMSLHLIDKLFGEELARQTAKQMEFDWLPNPS